MLQVQHICKEYRTGGLVQRALDDFSLNLRDNEFVAILGPSGSGKTTLLNIIGGLDQYDSGELIINGVSTKKYKDRDWDSYRNHTIGFVFQSYNLIPHQTLVANVELALTISGVGRKERRQRAMNALEKVGLADQAFKRPNQLSGGQMQRVAIARALVNDPEILLADEPTGALDSTTSVQVMELLKEVAEDRLVVMVTHNPDLAQEYATRIVNLKDGHMVGDSDPFEIEEGTLPQTSYGNMGKAFMTFPTAVSLSFTNLLTKKARTLLTAFAGSIGIIGIALIMSLSDGVNNYIEDIEEETLSEYPLSISSSGMDLTSLMAGMGLGTSGEVEEGVENEVNVFSIITSMLSRVESNDLAALKEYIDSGESGMDPYINAIEYTYDVSPQIYVEYDDRSYRQVNPDSSFSVLGFGGSSSSSNMLSAMMSTDVFDELPGTKSLYIDQYDIKAGHWPENYDEVVLVLNSSGGITDFMLYSLGLRNGSELDDMVMQFAEGEDIETPEDVGSYTYEDMLGLTFRLVCAADYYDYDEQYKVWVDKTDNKSYMEKLVADSEELTIVGVVQPVPEATFSVLSSGIYYTPELIDHVAQLANDSQIVKDQLKHPDINVFTGEPFLSDDDEEEENEFDMESLFEIDEDALSEALTFDEDALSEALSDSMDFTDSMSLSSGSLDIGSLGLSASLDLGSLLSGMDGGGTSIDLSAVLSDLSFDFSERELTELFNSLWDGYIDYAGDKPGTDYQNLGIYFTEYLQSDSAREILLQAIYDIYGDGGQVTVDLSQISTLGAQLIPSYLSYIEENGGNAITDYMGFLNTPSAQSAMNSWIDSYISVDNNVTVTSDQLSSLTAQLVDGYNAYAAKNGYADLSKMASSFTKYLDTSEARELLTTTLSEVIDLNSLESQLGQEMQTYLTNMMNSYGSSLSGALNSQLSSAMSSVTSEISSQLSSQIEEMMTEMMDEMVLSLSDGMGDAMEIDEDTFADAFEFNMDSESLTELLMAYNTTNATYSGNLASLGYVDFDRPEEISIYPVDFPGKDVVVEALDNYNTRMADEGQDDKVITYTDTVGALMSSVTDIVNMISYVLIAFVAISLVVSSIMIGVITYISVLERQKEIGILRAIGASKGNISEVFNAETGIIGLSAGLLGVGVSLLIMIPGNMVIHHFNQGVTMVLQTRYGFILIALSVILTLIGGLIPSRQAARSDPVTALRTE